MIFDKKKKEEEAPIALCEISVSLCSVICTREADMKRRAMTTIGSHWRRSRSFTTGREQSRLGRKEYPAPREIRDRDSPV